MSDTHTTDLTGKAALVTGGTRGIGRTCALFLARDGARVAICGRNPNTAREAAEAIAGECGGEVRGYGCEISEPGSVAELVKQVAADLGPIGILVNNAGITRDGLLMRMKDDDWNAVLHANLFGAFYACRAVARDMLKQRWGRIINVSSIIGLRGQAGQANYAASKAGLIGFTKSLAQEFGSRNITANVVAPGYVETDMTSVLSEEHRSGILSQVPLGRVGSCEDIAHVVRFLAGEGSGYMTGAVLQVDGGLGM